MGDAALDARYPRVAAYLAGLPAGLKSYPECKVRIATYEHVLVADAGSRPTLAGVEPEMQRLITIPLRGLWIPEVYLLAGILTVGDQYHLTPEQHFEWLLERNRELFRSVVYRAVMAFLSPEQLLRSSSARWSNFHQGTTFKFIHTDVRRGIAELTFPPHLFDHTVAHVFRAVFVAALERANARSVSMTETEVSATSARYPVEWR